MYMPPKGEYSEKVNIIMEFLVFSDSHGASLSMKKVIDNASEELCGVIFLGDNYRDIEVLTEAYPNLKFYAVAGNCDMSARYLHPEYCEQLLVLDGVRVLMLHGHRQNVKYGFDTLEAYASDKGADIVLFGHTHERLEKYCLGGVKPLIMFNPGSISLPRDGAPSFGVLTVNNGQALLSHGDIPITLR